MTVHQPNNIEKQTMHHFRKQTLSDLFLFTLCLSHTLCVEVQI